MALFLDFDGTLVELAAAPHEVVLGPGLVPLLTGLSAALGGALGVVSGRPLAEIDWFLAPLLLPGAGLHGLEYRDRPGAATASLGENPEIALLRKRLLGQDPGGRGLVLEDKGAALALHFRQRPELGGLAREMLQEAVRDLANLHLVDGKMVVEVKPRHADKGSSVARLMRLHPFSGRRPVFLGDDVTDEDGMKMAARLGGFGIKVGEGTTSARHRLSDVAAVHTWLARRDFHDAG